jgi:hypothetical protein
MERYPTLAPKSHYGDTMRLLQELHSINYFSLTFSTKPQVAASLEGGVLELLEHGDITDRHREVLKYKLEVSDNFIRPAAGGLFFNTFTTAC